MPSTGAPSTGRETAALKRALKAAGIDARICRARGTLTEVVHIRIVSPAWDEQTNPTLYAQVMRIACAVTGKPVGEIYIGHH